MLIWTRGDFPLIQYIIVVKFDMFGSFSIDLFACMEVTNANSSVGKNLITDCKIGSNLNKEIKLSTLVKTTVYNLTICATAAISHYRLSFETKSILYKNFKRDLGIFLGLICQVFGCIDTYISR